MSQARRHDGLSWNDYLAWEGDQPQRCELVDGVAYARTGGTAMHDMIADNLRAEFRDRLRGRPCGSHGPDLKVKAGMNGRCPDALVDRGLLSPGAVAAVEPVAVFEVLSRSTAWLDQSLKLRDYDDTTTIRH